MWNISDSPCHGCPDRAPGCHARCVRYQEYTDARRAYNHMRKLEAMTQSPSPALEKTLRKKMLEGKRNRKHSAD